MQSYDENDQLVSAMYGTREELIEATADIATAKYHVIGELPERGEEVKINGLCL